MKVITLEINYESGINGVRGEVADCENVGIVLLGDQYAAQDAR